MKLLLMLTRMLRSSILKDLCFCFRSFRFGITFIENKAEVSLWDTRNTLPNEPRPITEIVEKFVSFTLVRPFGISMFGLGIESGMSSRRHIFLSLIHI